jgi:UDP-N-acetylmuramate dehydrogenase
MAAAGVPGPLTMRTLPLAPLTTLGLGGLGDRVVELTDADQLPDLARLLTDGEPPGWPVPIGGGSNVLVADDGMATPVVLIRTRGVRYHQSDADGPVMVTVEAGHPWPELAQEFAAEGLAGMETMTGIPGTVGAMAVQNVGAYGQETADTLVAVQAWDWEQGQAVTLSAAECRLGHRASRFKRNRRWLILTATFALSRGVMSAPVTYREVARLLDVPVGTRVPVEELMTAVEKVRAGKGMLLADAGPDARTVGSVFLSPRIDPEHGKELRANGAPVHDFADGSTRVSASWLMREAGLALGQWLAPGVRVSTRHYTLVVDNSRDAEATTRAFVDAARLVQEQVLQATGVCLTPEPDIVGTVPGYQRLIDRAQAAADPR